MEHTSNIKYIMPAERYISQLPDYELFGHQTRLCLNPRNIPDLSWKWADTINTQDRQSDSEPYFSYGRFIDTGRSRNNTCKY